jgi:hypothetical protein
MIVFGAALHGGSFPETPVAIGAAYDPVADSWRRIADSELSPQASTASWTGSGMVAWDYLNRSQTYDPVLDGWSHVEEVPLPSAECTPQSASPFESRDNAARRAHAPECRPSSLIGRLALRVDGAWLAELLTDLEVMRSAPLR